MIPLRPGDVFVSRDGYTVRALTETEQAEIRAKIRAALLAASLDLEDSKNA